MSQILKSEPTIEAPRMKGYFTSFQCFEKNRFKVCAYLSGCVEPVQYFESNTFIKTFIELSCHLKYAKI